MTRNTSGTVTLRFPSVRLSASFNKMEAVLQRQSPTQDDLTYTFLKTCSGAKQYNSVVTVLKILLLLYDVCSCWAVALSYGI